MRSTNPLLASSALALWLPWSIPALAATPAGTTPEALLPAPAPVIDIPGGVGPRNSRPESFVPFEDLALFVADDPLHGRELFLSDGTAEGTRMVVDACAGLCDGVLGAPTVAGERFFFAALELDGRLALWSGDGEEVRRLHVFRPAVQAALQSFAPFGSLLLFAASGGDSGVEPWVSDGTPEGTHLLADLCPAVGCSSLPSGFTALGDTAYFSARDPERGEELFQTDGTTEGTRRVSDICRGLCDSYPGELTRWRGYLWFHAHRTDMGYELWSVAADGGVRLEADLLPGRDGSFPRDFFIWSDRLYFRAELGDDQGTRWYRIDQPGAAPVPAAELAFGVGPLHQMRTLGDGLLVTELGDDQSRLWFLASPASHALLLETVDGGLAPLGQLGTIAFYAQLGAAEWALWASDGTPGGTRRVQRLGRISARPGAVAGDALLFSAAGTEEDGLGLWTVMASGSAVPLHVTETTGPSSSPFARTAWGEDAARLAFLSRAAGEVWSVAGIGVGRLADLEGLRDLVRLGDGLAATDTTSVWRLDGTRAPVLLYEGQTPTEPTIAGSTLFFGTYGTGQELWASDGTAEGTRLVVDADPSWSDGCPILCPGPPPTYPRELTAKGDGRLAFVVDPQGSTGEQIWLSDGTSGGTVVLGDGEPLADDGPFAVDQLTAVGDALFFVGVHQDEADRSPRQALWRWRPGSAPERLTEVTPDGELSLVRHLPMAAAGARLFVALPWTGGSELWTAGATGPARRVHRFGSVADPAYVRAIGPFGSRVLLAVLDLARGEEPWVSDGVTTTFLGDLEPGAPSSRPTGFTTVGACSLFAAAGGGLGHELWLTDGTAAGTVPVLDLAPRGGASTPRAITPAGGRIYFVADDSFHGRELFAVDRKAVDALCRAGAGPSTQPPPPEGPWLESPSLRGFRVKALIGQPEGPDLLGSANADCIPETLCIAGALPERTELFVRVIGPRPNGKLWPVLVRFTPSPLEVWIEQRSTGEINYYRLPGSTPGSSDLDGLFDRQGFEPEG